MSKERPYLIPLFLFLFSLILRITLISKGPYHVDCFDLAMKSQATLDKLQLHYLYGSGYPFTVVLGALFILLLKPFGVSDPVFAVNFMSVVFGSLCIPALYIVARRLTGDVAALFAALMFSVIPVFLGVSVYGKNHAPSLFLLLTGIHFLFCYTEKKKFSDLIFCGVSLGLLGATRNQDLILMVPALLYVYFCNPVTANDKSSAKPNIKHLILLGGITTTITLILHLPLMLRTQDTYYKTQLWEFVQIGVLKNFLWLDGEMLHWSLMLTITNFTLGGFVMAIIGLIAIAGKGRRIFFFLLLWFLIPIFFYANLRSTVERFLIISYLPLLIGQGYLLSRLREWRPVFQPVAIVAFAAMFFMLLWDIFPILRFRHLHDHLTGYARWVAQQTEPNAVIIVGDENVIIRHYAQRETLPQLMSIMDPITDQQYKEYKETLDGYFKEGRTVYITGGALSANNPGDEFKTFLEKNYHLEVSGRGLYQDWHLGETHHQFFKMRLLKITPK